MKKKIICTIGPSSYNKKVLENFKKMNVNLFRINLSHTPINDLNKKILFLKKNKVKNICLDTEGAQIRTTKLRRQIFKKNQTVFLNKLLVNTDKKKIGLYPDFNFLKIKKNDKIKIGFEGLTLKVKNVKKNTIHCVVTKDGKIESNKGVHISKNISLPPLTKKDIQSIKIGLKNKIKFYALSFANSKNDVLILRNLIGSKNNIISKIETINALKNLEKISTFSDSLLLDRGDLSRYIPIETLPMYQEKILKFCKRKRKKIFVATNLLETMVTKSEPTRAESNDIYFTLKQGADGLVLAAETAIGKYPIESVHFIKKCIETFKKNKINYFKKINRNIS